MTARLQFLPYLTRLLALTAVAGTLTPGAAAEDELPDAATILDRYVEITGGREAYLAQTTRVCRGTIVSQFPPHPKMEADFATHIQAPDQWHLQVSRSDVLNVTRVFNGTRAWELHSQSGNREIDGEEKLDFADQARLHGIVEWRDRYPEVRTVAAADVDGRPAWEVRVTTPSGEQFSQFYDKDTGFLIRYTRVLQRRGGSIDAVTYLHDYRPFDGVLIPTRVEQLLRNVPGVGEGTQTWHYRTVDHTAPIPAALFVFPSDL